MQRAYPHGQIDVKAYRAALENRNNYIALHKGPFDNEWTSDSTLYVGTASGGIFLSDDMGQTYRSVFDEAMTSAIGDIAISRNNPDHMLVGTGEANAGGASIAYDGVGVYGSEDGGESWTHLGLDNAGSIGKVVIDPEDDNTIFVAAMGSLFANNEERGIYKTDDKGESWEQVLFLSDSTGGIDLAIHPQDGNVIYAAMWERIRKPYNRQYGGETSGIYRSLDGGTNWQELTTGLPTAAGDKGRIGLAISESHPNIIYAYYANAFGILNGIYKTEDGGDNWFLVNSNVVTTTFNWWFGKIYVHPTNPDDVYLTNINMFRSKDGGNSWYQVFEEAHYDHHAMAIHPTIPDLVYNGNDGGVNQGMPPDYRDSEYRSGLNNFQFYACTIDPNNPEILYGGSQDNGIVKTTGAADEWTQLQGGDGFRVVVDPSNSDIVYYELRYAFISKSDEGGPNPKPASSGLAGLFNWNAPLTMDPHDSNVLYTGSQKLYRTTNAAESWEAISDTLVRKDNPQGNQRFGTITTVDVSIHDSQLIYVGTDDGNVWVTRDAGASYDLIKGSLPNRWITAIAHDPHLESGVYVTISGFRFGESEAQVYYSDNYGEEWTAIGSNLPDVPVNDIIADGFIDELIYVATDIGIFVSADKGFYWSLLGTNVPSVPVTDLDIHNEQRILVAATYGKGIYTYQLPVMVSSEELGNDVEVQVYPNPTAGLVQVSSKEDVQSISVYDISGKYLIKRSFTRSLDLSSLPSGQYVVVIKSSDRETRKIIIRQ